MVHMEKKLREKSNTVSRLKKKKGGRKLPEIAIGVLR